tara:strand:- start:217 stop:654 length:438 start_codon:yes stop_codon:yes gene_type:complete
MKAFCRYDYGFSKEIEMLIKINDLLKDELLLIKTKDKYCCVDYIMKNEKIPHQEAVIYIELKSRRNITNFNDLMIGETKLYNISKLDKPTILLWIDNDKYYYCYFDKKFLKYKNGYCGGSGVIYIPKKEMVVGDLASFVELLNLV